MKIGIDASNLLQGGGRTHLRELLAVAQPENHGIQQVIVWGCASTLEQLSNRPWLLKQHIPLLERGPIIRAFWQQFQLGKLARDEKVDLLFAPGGSIGGDFHPSVTMCQNMLPWEWPELKRYRGSWIMYRLLLLRLTQARSFHKADGLIFLTDYARNIVQQATKNLKEKFITTIPHGIHPRFFKTPRSIQNSKNTAEPLRLIYVSIIDLYKHQWQVVEAVHRLRLMGYSLELDLIGPANPAALGLLFEAIENFDPENGWVRYHGAVASSELHLFYQQADIGIFASSCENLPNILIETMAAGLPIACSHRGPMPEILGDAGIYFAPEDASDIAISLQKLIDQPELRLNLANSSYERSKYYSWESCADSTFAFLVQVAADFSREF